MKEKRAEIYKKAENIFHRTFDLPLISFKLRGKTAGYAKYRENSINLNPVLCAQNFDDFLGRTLPHEISHLITFQVYGASIKPHGFEWQSVMLKLGYTPKRCHNYDTSSSVGRRVKRCFVYKCFCQTHSFTSIINNRILRGAVYTCKRCKQPLTK